MFAWIAGRAGLLIALLLGGVALCLAPVPWLAAHGVSALMLAMLLGMALAGVRRPGWQPGLNLAKGPLLRLGVALFGLRLTLADIAWRRSGQLSADGAPTPRPPRPWFVLGFVAAAALAGSGWLPEALRQLLWQVDAWLLAAAMAALGLDIRPAMLRAAGWRPLALAGALWLWLMLGGGGINWLLSR